MKSTYCSVSNEWAFRGIDSTVMENQDLRVLILHGKGTDISEIVYKPLGLNLMFRNPWGPKSPRLFPNVSPHSATFRDYTGGGWSDVLPNAGDPCDFKGARFGMHDETPLLAWSSRIEENSRTKVSARFDVKLNKYPLSVSKLVSLDTRNRLTIVESITNESKDALPFSWVVHPTFSTAFVDETARLDLSASKISVMETGSESYAFPRYVDSDGVERDVRRAPPLDATIDSTLLLSGVKEGRYSITNPGLGLRFTLTWDLAVFPYVWYYRSINAKGYPYYGRSRFVAVEPCTSRTGGLVNQVAAKDAPSIGPGKTLTTTMVATVSAR
jgi:galactose mutarotase-like enzyme